MSERLMRIGEVASRTGLTVRALRHYHHLGLMPPRERTPSGHRLYDVADLDRLQAIACLRRMGLSLAEIQAALDETTADLATLLGSHVARLTEEIEARTALREDLEWLRARLTRDTALSPDDLTRTIWRSWTMERYYTPEQLSDLSDRRTEVGEARIAEVKKEWQELFDAFAGAMHSGLDPASDEVAQLARRAASLVEEFTGGDPDLRQSLSSMYASEGADAVMARHSMELPLGVWEYMGRASAALDGQG